MNSYDSQFSAPRAGQFAVPVHRFRIVCRRADHSLSVISVFSGRVKAVEIAEKLVDRHLQKLRLQRDLVLQNPLRPRLVWIEHWIGSVVEGAWVELPKQDGGYRFEFFDQPPRGFHANGASKPVERQGQGKPRGPLASCHEDSSPKSGDHVVCELLSQRTRKGGWFAKPVGYSASGPVTNSDAMPAEFQAGQRVILKLCGIKLESGFAQFAWEPSSSDDNASS